MTNTYAPLDSGSQSTLIRKYLANHLGLKVARTKIKISIVKDYGDSMCSKEVTLKIFDTNGNN